MKDFKINQVAAFFSLRRVELAGILSNFVETLFSCAVLPCAHLCCPVPVQLSYSTLAGGERVGSLPGSSWLRMPGAMSMGNGSGLLCPAVSRFGFVCDLPPAAPHG